MESDITRYMWVMTNGTNSLSCPGGVLSFDTEREVHAPGEYVSLEQWLRMIRPGRQLL